MDTRKLLRYFVFQGRKEPEDYLSREERVRRLSFKGGKNQKIVFQGRKEPEDCLSREERARRLSFKGGKNQKMHGAKSALYREWGKMWMFFLCPSRVMAFVSWDWVLS